MNHIRRRLVRPPPAELQISPIQSRRIIIFLFVFSLAFHVAHVYVNLKSVCWNTRIYVSNRWSQITGEKAYGWEIKGDNKKTGKDRGKDINMKYVQVKLKSASDSREAQNGDLEHKLEKKIK